MAHREPSPPPSHNQPQSLACPPDHVPEASNQPALCWHSRSPNVERPGQGQGLRELRLCPRLEHTLCPRLRLPAKAGTSHQSDEPRETRQHSWSQCRGTGATKSQFGRSIFAITQICMFSGDTILLPPCKEPGQEVQGYPNPDQFQTLTSMKATITEPTITTLAFRVAQSNREKDRPPFSVNLSMSGEAAQGKASIGWVPSLPLR